MLQKKTIVLILIALVAVSVTAWYFLRPQGTVTFTLAPEEVQLTIGKKEQTITSGQKISLSPGLYSFHFSRDGFASETRAVTIEDKKNNELVMALLPRTDEAKKIMKEDSNTAAVLEKFEKQYYKEFTASLPITGIGYSISACQSLKNPESKTKALCIAATDTAGEDAAYARIKQAGFDPDKLDILFGTETIKTVSKTSTYTIDYKTNVAGADPEKQSLFITPLNVPYVAYSKTTLNPQLEAIKTAALADLKQKGYDLDKYEIYYSNIYLSKYNPNADVTEEHAMPPIKR